MKVALVGGTHGNEPVGLEVLRYFQDKSPSFHNSYACFWGNPRAFEIKKRYVDTDLNRAFGDHGIRCGYEEQRVQELQRDIHGKFDFCIDLHTTTSNMGLNAILNNTHENTQKAAAFLKEKIPEIHLIEEGRLDSQCNHLNRLCPGGLTIEVGPVANNVVNAQLVLQTREIVEALLDFDFSQSVETSETECYRFVEQVNYPEEPGWYIHPRVEASDFQELQTGDPLFINILGETRSYSGPPLYPFFINEAAYLENASAFLLAERVKGFSESPD